MYKMEKEQKPYTMESFINQWNAEFQNHSMTAQDLKKPHAVMEALFQIFERLGIEREAVLSVPEDARNDHTPYYWDLIPIINTKRVVNHLISALPNMNNLTSFMHFLQPTNAMYSILLILFNLMVFREERLREIEPHEEGLFSMMDQVKALDEKKNRLLEMLNEQAQGKGKRAERLEKLTQEIKQYEEELKQEKDEHDVEKLELESIMKENKQIEMMIEQKKSQRDALMAEIAKKKALRVYDAEDIQVQAEQAAKNVQEAEEKLTSLRATLMQKENSLKNLQTIKPNLDTANNLLFEIKKLSGNLKDLDSGDLDMDSREGELVLLNTDLGELRAELEELSTARQVAAAKRSQSHTHRQVERTATQSSLHDMEDKDKKLNEKCKEALQMIEKIKKMMAVYEEKKTAGLDELAAIKNGFCAELKSIEDLLIKKATEVEKSVEEKLRSRQI